MVQQNSFTGSGIDKTTVMNLIELEGKIYTVEMQIQKKHCMEVEPSEMVKLPYSICNFRIKVESTHQPSRALSLSKSNHIISLLDPP